MTLKSITLFLLLATWSQAMQQDDIRNLIANIGANRAEVMIITLNKNLVVDKDDVLKELFDENFLVKGCDEKGEKSDLKEYLGVNTAGDQLVSVTFSITGPNTSEKVDRGDYAFDYEFKSNFESNASFEGNGTAVIDINESKFLSAHQSCPVAAK
uniref:Uncharacterized protein n=1 Tax=Caenorhabditis japonica TaxID=281687 RepID=A0A8R1HU74_CAEJA